MGIKQARRPWKDFILSFNCSCYDVILLFYFCTSIFIVWNSFNMSQLIKKGFGLLLQNTRPLRLSLDPLAGASGTCRSVPSFDRCRRQYSVFEPDGLDEPPEIPEYEVLNIRMRGY